MGTYAVLKRIYHAAVPKTVRDLTWQSSGLRRFLGPLKVWIQGRSDHDEVYDKKYYLDTMIPLARASAPMIAKSIRDVLQPSSVTDVGCGTGELLLALRNVGIPGAGFEYSQAAIEIAREQGVEVNQLNLEQEIDRLPVRRADLAVSTEVAEHLPESCAETFVEYLCRTADTVVFTAAPPGQGGTDHVNEQPPEYWIEKFAARGFAYQEELTRQLKRDWESARVASIYWCNLMLFRKESPTAR